MPTELIRVLCVEDNQLVADAIARKLEGDARFEWLGWVQTAQGLAESVEKTPPDVVCMDIDIPGEDAFAMVRSLTETCPTARVLMLTGHVREELIERALSAGAWGYLSKGEESRVIVDGICRVASGEFVLGTIARDRFHGQVPPCPVTPHPDASLSGADGRNGWGPVHVIRRVIRKLTPPR